MKLLFCSDSLDVDLNDAPKSFLEWNVEALLFNLREPFVFGDNSVDVPVQMAVIRPDVPQRSANSLNRVKPSSGNVVNVFPVVIFTTL